MKAKAFVYSIASYLLFLSACHNPSSNASTSGFELSGKLSGGGEGINIYLDRISPDGIKHLDSTKLNNGGTFSFHTNGIYKGFYTLRITQSDFATLILDSTEKVHVEGNSQFLGNTYTVTGSPDSKIFWDLNQESKVNYGKRDSLQKYYEALMNASGGNKKRIDSLNNAVEAPYDTLVNRQNRYLTQFLKSNLNSFASIAAIQQLDADKYLSYYISLDSALSKKYPTSIYIKLFHDKVESTRRTAIGVPAPEISLPDTNGNPITLSSFKGKVVLIDFWASWCAPCRASLPGIVKLYEKYKNKNFTILSVSLDKEK
ncbi:MAG TPA: TlpA disulfide reductase family protein, partial [Bacteroidia bacterium]|nr:TlpA disulfide reductase family protein [Bacteroidia bacterium]